MSFETGTEASALGVGRYSSALAAALCDVVGVHSGDAEAGETIRLESGGPLVHRCGGRDGATAFVHQYLTEADAGLEPSVPARVGAAGS